MQNSNSLQFGDSSDSSDDDDDDDDNGSDYSSSSSASLTSQSSSPSNIGSKAKWYIQGQKGFCNSVFFLSLKKDLLQNNIYQILSSNSGLVLE